MFKVPVIASNSNPLKIVYDLDLNIGMYKVPKHFVFGDLPKTSTGKIQKFELRKLAKEIN